MLALLTRHVGVLASEPSVRGVERVDADGTSVTGAPAPPAADGPALFLCGDGQCSSPVRAPAEVEAAARAFGSGR